MTRKVIIIGSGPAGYTAGVYLARAELQPLIFAGEQWGGQLMLTTEVENYPGFSDGIMGPKLMAEMRAQAEKFGAEVADKSVSKVDFSTHPFKVNEVLADAVIVATGAEARLLGVPGEKKFMGRGVSTCAVCDAPFYKGKSLVYVVGGGDAAMEEVLALSKFAQKVGVIHRREGLKASKIMQRKVEEKGNVEFLWNREVVEIKGEQKATSVVVKNNQSGEVKELVMDGIFIAVGHTPTTAMLMGKLELDQKGYIKTGFSENYPTMTSIEGVFAAGDVVDWRYRQAVTAAGMGCLAALGAEKYLDNLKFKI